MSLRRVVGRGILSQNSRKATKTSYIETRCTQCSQVQISALNSIQPITWEEIIFHGNIDLGGIYVELIII